MEAVRFWMGSDPELFLRDAKTKQLRSAIPIVKEGKHAPRQLNTGTFDRVLHDNVLIEFNTTPADSREEFVATVKRVLRQVSEIAGKAGTELHLQASAEFPATQLRSREAKIFGCDADYDAWALTINHVSAGAARARFRSAGGHLHIGIHEADSELGQLLDDPLGKVKVVKALDAIVGIISVFLDKDPTAAARRGLYGKAGAHRPKTYGVEYRACSPWWLASPEHTALVYDLSAKALAVALDDEQFTALIKEIGGESELQRIINDSDVDAARAAYEECLEPLLDFELLAAVAAADEAEAPEFTLAWRL